jgi:phage terminase large subunit
MGDVLLPSNNWTPRKDQMALCAYLFHGGKRAVEVAHRRWG